MTILWFDSETYSECDLSTHGTPRYAEHESTEIIVAQWALNDDEPMVHDCTGRQWPPHLVALLEDPTITVVAHNSMFDRTLLRHCWGIDVPVERWYDTMIQAMAHGLPGSLDKISGILGLSEDEAKDKRGRQLIQLFCKPQPRTKKRNTRATHPKEWAEFLEYSRQDIVAMRAISKKLPKWNYSIGSPEHKLWQLDQRVNDRGFAVDLDLAHSAIDAVAVEQARLKADTQELTMGEVSAPSKRDALLKHIVEYYGVTLPDMKADTLRRRVEDPELPQAVKTLLAIRLEATKTSTAKYKAVVSATSADGRLRNTLQFAGAQRTARWAGRVFQPQNMTRPDMKLIAKEMGVSIKEAEDVMQDYLDAGVAALKAGDATILFGDVMGLSANLVRGCIVAPPGKKLTIADLANIEGRGLAHLAGEEWKVRAFREYDAGTGPDLYKLACARSFGITPAEVDKTGRQIGKVQELGLGYQGGVAAFLTFAAVYEMDLDAMADAVHRTAPKDALAAAHGMWEWAEKKKRTLGLSKSVYVACETLKALWRAAHPATVALWEGVEDIVVKAVNNPGQAFTYRSLAAQRNGAWLRVRLPSGRYLCYLNPKIEDGNVTYSGVNQYTRQWCRIKTYGGKLCVAEGTLVLAKRGWTTIESITADDEVWDGVEWVRTDGNVCNGTREVIDAYGAWMTPDHLVLTTEGWRDASQSEGHQRRACRLPDGVALPRERRAQVAVGDGLRLRGGEDNGRERVQEARATGCGGVVRLQAQGNYRAAEHNARHEQASGVCRVAQHGGPLPAAFASGVGQLRRARHHGLRQLGRVLRQLLGRHGRGLQAGVDAGSGRQRPGVRPRQLPVGHLRPTGQQHPGKQKDRRQDGGAAGARARCQTVDDVLQAESWRFAGEAGRPAGRVAQVYDLINCGPRHRFVIWAGDAPLIVHNCENVVQAWARDVLAHNMPAIDAAGYEIVLTVHDEILTETPDTSAFSAKALGEMMSIAPPWALGCPLSAAGFETYRYRKE